MPNISILTLAVSLLLALPVWSQSTPDNEVVGIVNRKAITRYDILEGIKKDDIEISELSASEQLRLFDQRVTFKVISIVKEEASRQSGISISEEDYVNIKNRAIEQLGGEAGFKEHLIQIGQDEEEFDRDFRREQEQLAWLRVVSGRGGGRLSRDLRPMHDLTIHPREIRAYYKKHLETEFTLQDEAIVRVIQVYGSGNNASRAEQLLEGLKRKLATKADFAVLAEKNSEHTSKSAGGLIGSVVKGKGTLLPEVVEAEVFSETVKSGDVIGPIQNINSYWLVKVEGKQKARVVGFDEAQDYIRSKLYAEKSERVVTKVTLNLVKDAYISPPELKRKVVGALELRLSR